MKKNLPNQTEIRQGKRKVQSSLYGNNDNEGSFSRILRTKYKINTKGNHGCCIFDKNN
jgi:hypothetical protein